jgi:uncharacterized membrane protein YsdA (DUF1294 family)
MNEQNFANHRRYVAGYHFLLSALLFIGTIVAIFNIIRHKPNEGGYVSTWLIALLFVCATIIFIYLRQFPMKAQDRAIRAEQALRYYILTQKPLSHELTIYQVAALRFAADDEFIILVDRALAEKLSPDDIKKAIQSWNADHHRV